LCEADRVPPPLSTFVDRLLRPHYVALEPGGAPAFGLPARPAQLYRARARDMATGADAPEPIGRYLRRAVAAGHGTATIERLHAIWTTWGPDHVRRTIGRFDQPSPGRVPGPGPANAGSMVQCDGTTCGATVVVAARMIADPAFAHHITTAPPATFAAAQQTVQRAANVLWPRLAGVTPWGVRAAMNVHSGLFGARYGVRPIDPTRPDRVRLALEAVGASVTAGWPVPLLVGRWEPRHWVLALDTRGAETLLCYEPTNGRVAAVTVEDLAARRAKGLGYKDLLAMVYPVRLA
jgi:hypothetical protein